MFQNNKDFLYWIISVHTYIVIGMDFPECICPKRYIKTVYNNNRRDSHFQFFNQYFPYRPLGPIFYLSDSCERFKRFLIKNLNLFCLQPSRIVDIACEHPPTRPRQSFALVARRVPQCVIAAYALRYSVFRHRDQALVRIVSIRPRSPASQRIARRVVIRYYFFDIPEIVVFVEIRLVQRRVVLADQAVDVVIGIADTFSADRPLTDIPVLIVLVFVREVQTTEFHF